MDWGEGVWCDEKCSGASWNIWNFFGISCCWNICYCVWAVQVCGLADMMCVVWGGGNSTCCWGHITRLQTSLGSDNYAAWNFCCRKKRPQKSLQKAHLFKNHHHAYYEMATSTLLGMAYIVGAYIGSFFITKFDFIATFYALKAALRSGLWDP